MDTFALVDYCERCNTVWLGDGVHSIAHKGHIENIFGIIDFEGFLLGRAVGANGGIIELC